ncbi:MAG: AIR synthase related protein, partial [Perlucidibaca sp.]
MALDEFGLIRRYFTRPGHAAPGLRLGIGDDDALLDLPAGETLAFTTDTLVAGRHFPPDALPFDIGWKALAVNLSDLAAMGARPLGVTLALTLPEADEAWLTAFSSGFFTLADAHAVPLMGGDTTRGPQSNTVTALGAVTPARALRREGARAGDQLYV